MPLEVALQVARDATSWFLPALFGFLTALYSVRFNQKLQRRSENSKELQKLIQRLLAIDHRVIIQMYGLAIPGASKEDWKPFRKRENELDEVEVTNLLAEIELLADQEVYNASKRLMLSLASMFSTRHAIDQNRDWSEDNAELVSKTHDEARKTLIHLTRKLIART